MADVYQAKDLRLDRDVAIKLIFQTSSDKDKAFDEAKILAKVNHPNVVQVFDVFRLENHIAIVMEFVDGVSIHHAARTRFPDLETKLDWLIQLAQGIKAIHSATIIHSDLKPTNVLVTKSGKVKILDFGIAQNGCSEQNMSNGFASQHYTSPEQLKGEPVSYQSDLFSFGILGFELLADSHPFGAIDYRVKNIQQDKVTDAHAIIPAVNIELANTLNRLLQHKASQRPERVDEVETTLLQSQKLLAADYAQETQELVPASKGKSKKPVLMAIIGGISILLAWATHFWLADSPIEHFVVIKKPRLTESSEQVSAFNSRLLATVDDALRQGVISQKYLRLLPDSFDQVGKDQVQQAASIVGATLVIWPEISCSKANCEVKASVMEQQRQGSPWSVVRQHNWVVQSQTPVGIYNATHDNLRLLMPQLHRVDNNAWSAQFYDQYITIYSRFWFHDDYDDSSLDSLDDVLFHVPQMNSAYSLYRVISLNMYDKSGDVNYLKRFEQLLKNAPDRVKSSLVYAVELFMLRKEYGQFELARPLLEEIAQRGGGATLVQELKAGLFIASGEYEKAVEFYTAAVATRPSLSNLYGLAYTYYAIGKLDESEQTSLAVIGLDPSYLPARNLLANIYLLQEKLDLSIQQYLALIDVSPHSFYLSNLSVAYMLNRQYAKAHEYAQQAVDDDPENITWLLNLADIKQIQGASEGANALYLRILQNVREEDPVSLLIAAQANAQLGSFETAINQANRGIKKTPDNGETAFNAAIVFTLAGEHLSAINQIKEALRLDISHIWFTLPWFKPLCQYPSFVDLMSKPQHGKSTMYTQAVCSM